MRIVVTLAGLPTSFRSLLYYSPLSNYLIKNVSLGVHNGNRRATTANQVENTLTYDAP